MLRKFVRQLNPIQENKVALVNRIQSFLQEGKLTPAEVIKYDKRINLFVQKLKASDPFELDDGGFVTLKYSSELEKAVKDADVIFSDKVISLIGGDSESAIFAQSIAHLYPDDTFYLVSRNNFSKLPIETQMKINKNNNLVDCWKNYDKSIDNQDWLISYFKNIKIDFGLLYSGLSGSSTIPNYMYLKNGEYAKPLSSSKNYTGIITKFLNDSQIPYMEMGEDSRFFPLVARDLYIGQNVY